MLFNGTGKGVCWRNEYIDYVKNNINIIENLVVSLLSVVEV